MTGTRRSSPSWRARLVPLALLVLVGAAGGEDSPRYRVETVAAGLSHPWAIAFLPGGDLLVTERAGRLLRIAADGQRRPVAGVPPTYVRSQAGLFDVLLALDFPTSRRLYLSYAHGTTRANGLRVASARLDGDALVALTVLFEARPLKATAAHYGGRLAWLPDETLLVTTGDGFDHREAAQRLDSHLGKTIRLAADGSVPADNPFVGVPGAAPELWSVGHRNPQGLVVSPEGRVFLHEHGPRGGDELNLLLPGANYGWPIATQGVDYTGARITPYTTWPGTRDPLLHWTPSIAPADMVRYDGDLFPGWRGDLLVASLAERSIRRLDVDAGVVVGQSFPFPTLEARFRAVRVGPEGAVYLLTDDDEGVVLRLLPDPRPAPSD